MSKRKAASKLKLPPFSSNIREQIEAARKVAPIAPGPAHTGIVLSDGSAARRTQKKNFAQALSEALAIKFADGLRENFSGILPTRDVEGGPVRGNESPARTLKGVKKLDVNYSKLELGLGLGVSIKTLNFRDASSKRYTKNVTRVDNELRAEAGDYHERQPFAVLAAVVFLPLDAATDGEPSSFSHAAQTLRFRTGRQNPRDGPELFERIYIALYEPTDPDRLGDCVCFDAARPPPKTGLPKEANRLTLLGVLDDIKQAYDQRNVPKQIYEESDPAADPGEELSALATEDPELLNPADDLDED
jgi:hypothetical protein